MNPRIKVRLRSPDALDDPPDGECRLCGGTVPGWLRSAYRPRRRARRLFETCTDCVYAPIRRVTALAKDIGPPRPEGPLLEAWVTGHVALMALEREIAGKS